MWTEEAYKKWWYRMGEIFGTRWYETNGPEATNLWQQSLMEWSFHRAAAVIEHYRVSGHAHPPTLSEIVKVARTLKVSADNAPKEEPKRINGPELKREQIQAEFNRLRDIKRGGQKNAFFPDESMDDYLQAFRKSGMKLEAFENERLRLKKEMRERPDPEAIAERAAIQNEGN